MRSGMERGGLRVRVALAGLIAAGVGLRLWMILAWRPALIGFPHTYCGPCTP